MADNDNQPQNEDERVAQQLAEEWKLEFRESSGVAVDPRALQVLPGADCRRLRAVPLELVGGNAVVGVAAPGEERFEAIRAVAGPQTRFVVITERTLEALLQSRIFAGSAAETKDVPEARSARAPEPAADRAPASDDVRPEPKPGADEPEVAAPRAARSAARAAAPAGAPLAVDEGIVDAIVTALESRFAPAARPASHDSSGAEVLPSDLLAKVDESIAAWTTVRSSLDAIGTELDETRKNLRETKEQLSVAHAENDQFQHRVQTLEAEVADSRRLLDEAKSRLQGAFEALGGVTES